MSEKKDISVKMKDSYLVECKVVVLVGIGFVYALEDHNGESNDHVQADHSARDSSDHWGGVDADWRRISSCKSSAESTQGGEDGNEADSPVVVVVEGGQQEQVTHAYDAEEQ